jgi:hypothetical protein
MKFAPRISPRLIAVIDQLAARELSSAEICRLVGEEAERIGLTRPSYQRVRVLVLEARRRPPDLSTRESLSGIAYPFRSPTILWPMPPRRR